MDTVNRGYFLLVMAPFRMKYGGRLLRNLQGNLSHKKKPNPLGPP